MVAFDCELNDMVLFIPWVLSFAGDNPIQSEIASHIGLNGKYICHACYAHGNLKEGERTVDQYMDFMNVRFPMFCTIVIVTYSTPQTCYFIRGVIYLCGLGTKQLLF